MLPKLSRRSSREGSGERETEDREDANRRAEAEEAVLLRRLWVPISIPRSPQTRRASCTASSSAPERALIPVIHCTFSAQELASK